MRTGRLEAFSDGVLAIAITLLVLDLRLPAGSNKPIGDLLAEQWPSYLAYLVSFVVIGIMWVNHHALFRQVAHVDRALLFLNLGLLLVIAALPFPTSVAAEGLRRGGQDARVALFAYSLTQVLMAIAFSAIWIYIVRKPGILQVPMSASDQRRSIVRFSVGFLAYLALCGLAFLSPVLTLIGHALMAVYYAFEQLPDVPDLPEPAQAS
ncbi:MAG: TMEM175 family protein [Jatrophihabitantaceae bacterium]